MIASAYRVLLALVASCIAALASVALGGGVSLLVLIASVAFIIAAPLLRMLFMPSR